MRKSSVDYWSDVYGFNMSPFAKEAMKRTKPEITIIAEDQIISEPIEVLDLDLKYTDHSELDFIHNKTFISVKKTDKFQFFDIFATTFTVKCCLKCSLLSFYRCYMQYVSLQFYSSSVGKKQKPNLDVN